MKGPEFLESCAGRLHTRVGACWPGQRAVFRGRDLHRDLRNSEWLELYLFGITGRHFTPQETKLLQGIWVITSYPDARIWNNRVAGLAGSTRSTPILGLAAALAVTEALVYGAGPSIRAMDFFQGRPALPIPESAWVTSWQGNLLAASSTASGGQSMPMTSACPGSWNWLAPWSWMAAGT